MTDRRPSGRHVFHEKVSASLIVFFSVGLVDCLFSVGSGYALAVNFAMESNPRVSRRSFER
jgi:hypothetical protein